MNRITEAFLEAQILRLNRATSSPEQQYIKREDGQYIGQVGNYHLDHAYGGVALHRMCNESGGITDVFSAGHGTKRELSEKISAMLVGIATANE